HRLMVTSQSTFSYDDPRTDGTLHLIQTDGDLDGTVKAGNISGGLNGNLDKYGVWVRGVIKAPITVDLNLSYANIVATAIEGPVTIGRAAKGAIIATGDDLIPGKIDHIEIGYGELTSEQKPIYETFTPGLIGI